jgi:hypothetical protein
MSPSLAWIVLASVPAAPAPREPAPGGVVVLDNCDPAVRGKDRYEDGLALYAVDGRRRFRADGLNVSPGIGPAHKVAADPARGAIWVNENTAGRVRKFDRDGKELLVLDGVRANALAVDPATGNLWVLTAGETIVGDAAIVFGPDGKRLVTHEVWGQDLAYDAGEKAFWLVGKDLYKVPADAVSAPLLAKDLPRTSGVAAWSATSIAADPAGGRVWVVTARHPGVPDSRAELLGLDRAAKVQVRVRFTEDGDRPLVPFQVAADPAGGAWVAFYGRAVRRYGPDGKVDRELDLPAVTVLPDGSRGGVWVATKEEVLRVDRAGEVRARAKHARPTSHAWLAGD